MRVLVFEYATSGALKDNVETSILVEGFSMLKLAACGFQDSGVDVVTVIDSAFIEYGKMLDVEEVHSIESTEPIFEKIAEIAADVDLVYPIAPDHDLRKLIGYLNSKNISHLSCDLDALRITSDKQKTVKALEGFPTPKVYIQDVVFPAVVKPVEGVGCTDTFLVDGVEDMSRIREKLGGRFLIQEYISGTNASVTVISDGSSVKALSLNFQNITIADSDGKFNYNGGHIPLKHELHEECMSLAEDAVKRICGLKGLVGVDLVIGEKPYIIEINPRLTTSVIGLYNISDFDFRKAVEGKYKDKLQVKGCAFFSHILSPQNFKLDYDIIDKISKLDGIWCPPLSYSKKIKKGDSIGLAVTTGGNAKDAGEKLKILRDNVVDEVIS